MAAFGVLGSGVASADGFDYTPRGVGKCANVDMTVQPNNVISRVRVANAVLCLINAERTSRNIPALRQFIPLRGSRIRGLQGAAQQAALEASARPWWDTIDPQTGKKRSPHVNPYTGSTPETRIKASLYCSPGVIGWLAENAFEGAGDKSTARAAVSWWMGSTQGHRETLLDRTYRDTGVAVVYGSASVERAGANPSATFIETFGTCR